jgi:TolA-binding protein
MRRAGWICAVSLALALGANDARAEAADGDVSASTALQRKKIEAAGERRVAAGARPTLKAKANERQQSARQTRLGQQIPAALRRSVEQKVQGRIDRNLKAAQALRLDALTLLRQLAKELPKEAPERPSTLLRLGELEWEQAREEFLVRFARWEKKPSDQRGDPPEPDYRVARAHFETVLRDHPDFVRYDLALYVDGFLATEEGKGEQALERFERILSDHPHSPFIPDAHMVRAETEFSKPEPNYEYAFREYEAVLAHPDSELYELALFKSAWTLWRMGQPDEAARRFLKVFRASAERDAEGAARREELDQLQTEALRNLVAVFVEDEKNTADDMYGFLVKAGGERFAGEIVRALADTLYEQAHYERGIEAYRLLIKLEPTHADAYKHGLAIAEGHSTLELWAELDLDYRWLIAEYVAPQPPDAKAQPTSVASPEPAKPGAAEPAAKDAARAAGARPTSGGAWLSVQDPPTLAAAELAIRSRLYDDALGLHAKAQADKTSRAEFGAAALLYEAYLSRFSASEKAYEVYFNLGDIYFHRLGDANRAADAYLAAVRKNPRGQWSRDALYNALAALETTREAELAAAKAQRQKPEETATDKKLTEAMELYAKTYPDDPQVPELLFRQGRLYYDYEVYDPAVRQWGLLLSEYPSSTYARGAGELILDSFNKSKDYSNIETWGRRLRTAPAFQSPDAQARITTLIVQAIFKQGEQLAAAEQHAEAAEAYLRAAREFPKDKRAAQAGVNAAQEAQRAGQLDLLREAAALLLEQHRAEPDAAKGVWIAATTHQSVGLLAEAAGYHQALAEHWPNDTNNRDAAFNAVLLYATLGQRDQAVAAGRRFQKQYPVGDDSDEVTFLMGKAHENAEDWRSAASLYERYAQGAKLPSRRIEALVRLALARVELGDESGAKDALAQAMKQNKQSQKSLDDRGKYFGAKAHYLAAQRILAEFEKIKIEGDADDLKRRLKAKADLLKRAATALLETAQLGVAEWTTAALYQVGFIYESFAQALLNSPPPPSLTPEQREQYQMQIDEFVVPIEEKGLEAYESGWLKALDLGIYNAWTAKMREALGRLNTELYPPLREIGFELTSQGPRAFPGLIAGTRRGDNGSSQAYLITPPPAPKQKQKAPAEPARSASAAEARR